LTLVIESATVNGGLRMCSCITALLFVEINVYKYVTIITVVYMLRVVPR